MATHAINTIIKVGDNTGGASTGWPSNEADPSTGTSSSFTTIFEVLDISGPSIAADDEETTYHKASGKVKTFIQGLIDYGEVTFDVNHNPTNATHDNNTGLLADLIDGVDDRDFCIVFSDDPGDDSSSLWFTGYVKGFQPSNPVAGRMTASVTLKCNGNKIVLPI